jgi:hypothetical protein
MTAECDDSNNEIKCEWADATHEAWGGKPPTVDGGCLVHYTGETEDKWNTIFQGFDSSEIPTKKSDQRRNDSNMVCSDISYSSGWNVDGGQKDCNRCVKKKCSQLQCCVDSEEGGLMTSSRNWQTVLFAAGSGVALGLLYYVITHAETADTLRQICQHSTDGMLHDHHFFFNKLITLLVLVITGFIYLLRRPATKENDCVMAAGDVANPECEEWGICTGLGEANAACDEKMLVGYIPTDRVTCEGNAEDGCKYIAMSDVIREKEYSYWWKMISVILILYLVNLSVKQLFIFTDGHGASLAMDHFFLVITLIVIYIISIMHAHNNWDGNWQPIYTWYIVIFILVILLLVAEKNAGMLGAKAVRQRATVYAGDSAADPGLTGAPGHGVRPTRRVHASAPVKTHQLEMKTMRRGGPLGI